MSVCVEIIRLHDFCFKLSTHFIIIHSYTSQIFTQKYIFFFTVRPLTLSALEQHIFIRGLCYGRSPMHPLVLICWYHVPHMLLTASVIWVLANTIFICNSMKFRIPHSFHCDSAVLLCLLVAGYEVPIVFVCHRYSECVCENSRCV